MENTVRARVPIGADHTVRLPDEIPAGEADLIVLFPAAAPADADRARRVEARWQMFGRLRGQIIVADDFDAPLPEDVLRDFEGGEATRCAETTP